MLDDVLDTVRRLALAAFMVLLLGIGIGGAVSYGLMVRPAMRDLEVLYADVARLEAELEQCRADAAAGATELEACAARGDPVEEYYRGGYDLCLYLNLYLPRPADCSGVTQFMLDQGWYGQPSPDWRWPLRGVRRPDDREARQW